MSINIQQFTIASARNGLQNKEFTCLELIESVYGRIRKHDGNIHAFLTFTEEAALEQAKEVDRKIKRNEPLAPLAGIPLAVKDVICTKGIRTTAASRILEEYIPPYDATIVARLKEAGAIIIGKVNCDEFAHGASTENSAYGPSHNPWDLSRSPGGSSGGSSAALSAGFCLFALGTDTGGSTRQPAGWCNLYGLRPTYGRVSRYGLIAMTSSTDTPGIFTKTAEDMALVLSLVTGHDPNDATSLPSAAPDYIRETRGGASLQGIKIGLPKEFFQDVTHPASREVVDAAIADLEKLGAVIKPVSLPHTKYAVPVYYIITPAEVSSNLGRFDGIRYGFRSPEADTLLETYTKTRGKGFGPEAKRRIMLGTYALSAGYYDAYYKKAQKVRTIIADEVKKVLQEVDMLATPVSPHPPIKLGELADDPLAMYQEDIFMDTAVMAGIPALSIPAGFVGGLPVGLQLMGRQLEEGRLLAVAHAYEKEHEWVEKYPNQIQSTKVKHFFGI